MNSLALIESFAEFKDEKNIDRVTLMAIIEEAIRGVLKRKYNTDENFDIIVNPDKGDLEIWRHREIVKDELLEDENLEIALSDALKIEEDFEVGEEVSEEIKLISLGRRAILSLRQNLASKIMEYDNTNMYKHFKELEGEIVTGEVHHVRRNMVIVMDEDQTEFILTKEHQIGKDFFRKGDSIRAVLQEVELRGSKPVLKLSRTSPKFLEKLFEQEIPEILDGLITIKKVVRRPGEKAKVAVESYDDRIDPVGACVGMKGSRIHGIVRELNNENIDVINYTDNERLFIQRSLTPAKIVKMNLDEEAKTVDVYVHQDEVSRAIGRQGSNIRLATELTGYEINIYRDNPEDEDVEITEFSDEIEAWVIEELKKIGLDTAKSVLELTKEDLVKRTDLEEETAEEVLNVLKSEFE